MKQQGIPTPFRVKKFPNPPLRINGKSSFGNIEMPLSDVKNITSIGTDNSGFDFATTFKVIKFKVSVASNGVITQDYICNGNTLSIQAKEAILTKAKKGGKVYFEDITVQAPDGIRDFPDTKIIVK